jgi:hypothetical protein
MRTNSHWAIRLSAVGLLVAWAAGIAAPVRAQDKPAHEAILKDSTAVNGLIPLYQKGDRLYAEFGGDQYNSEYIVLISIARGIGQGDLLGGMSWGFGDDWVWTFRKVDENVHIVRKNVRFKADKGTPEATAVRNAYTDSVLFSLPIVTKGPKGGDLVDLTPVFMSDLPQIGVALPGFGFAREKSSWAAVKGFDKNVELQVAATYASGGRQEIESVPDSRGVTLVVHYSISKLPSNDYTPRLADDRVGYFLTVAKDYSKSGQRDQFSRYVNRWNLKKATPGDKPSPPKEPIIFWVEKTVPFKYRKPIIDGIREWNKAFEKAGYLEAIEVRQQPDDATWDPEDVHYNTFRWITAGAGFAMGPSRVNPYTGEILDADIIFDADFLASWKEQFETLTPATVTAMVGGPVEPPKEDEPAEFLRRVGRPTGCALALSSAPDLAFGEIAVTAAATLDPAKSAEELEKLIMQGLKYITMHEVGHTLGLRHNFKASTWMSLKDMNDAAKANGALVGSVMDYSPVNIVPQQDWTQGDYYQSALGPYDMWAIEYGYKELSGGTKGEVNELKKIAARGSEAGLDFTTDEDTYNWDPDPHSNRFDLGGDAIEYAKTRAQLVKELAPGLKDRITKDGDDFVQARQAFNVLLSKYGQSMFFASRYIGGMHTSRSHKGDANARPPLEPVAAAKQREALALLTEQVFSETPFQFPHDMYNYLAVSRWDHWGTHSDGSKDFPLHDTVLMWQDQILSQALSSVVLTRIHDLELKTPPDQDAFTTAELIEGLTKAIFSEVDNLKEGTYTTRKPAIGSLRRNLQRTYLSRLARMALGETGAPEDCQTMAYGELSSLAGRIDQLLAGKVALDSYSRAHLQESASRIRKVLDSRVSLENL